MPSRFAVARLWHEGNSFTPVPTRLADFRRRDWSRSRLANGSAQGARARPVAVSFDPAVSLELLADHAVERIGSTAAQRDGEHHEAPHQGVFVARARPAKLGPVDAGDHRHL